MKRLPHLFPTRKLLLLLGSFVLSASLSSAQTPALEDSSLLRLWETNSAPGLFDVEPSATQSSRVPRLRLFRIAPGFLADPIGMQDDDYDLPGVTHMPVPSTTPSASNGPEWIQLSMGADNPYVDLRRPGDPGGFGYYRVNTQVALFDTPTTTCTFGVQTVTPTGAQFGGLPNGPTVLSPSLSIFHALNDCLALQGFVAKNVPILDSDTSFLQRNVQYGLAVQRPLVVEGPEGLRKLYFSVGALGQLSPDRESLRLLSNYDVQPGLMWHLNDSWWVSSAVLVPMGTVRTAPGQWQLTCSLQF